jgi:pimeloyl-ACP methyl ester carboxylesterase
MHVPPSRQAAFDEAIDSVGDGGPLFHAWHEPATAPHYRYVADDRPVLVMHGAIDKMVPSRHGEWLAARCPTAELTIVPDAGHITVLDSAPEALTWLAARVHG